MDVEVVVEIPKGTRNKYEADHETGEIWLDRMLFTSTRYPEDYGYVPKTLAADGDPLDALVLLEEPTFPGCHVRARPVGVFLMSDESGDDAKLLCVTASDPRQSSVQDLEDLPPHELEEIAHFFAIYKSIEPGQAHYCAGLAVPRSRREGRRRSAAALPGPAADLNTTGLRAQTPTRSDTMPKACPTVLNLVGSTSGSRIENASLRAIVISTTARLSASRSSAQRASRVTCAGSMSRTSATQPWKISNASSRPILLPSIVQRG